MFSGNKSKLIPAVFAYNNDILNICIFLDKNWSYKDAAQIQNLLNSFTKTTMSSDAIELAVISARMTKKDTEIVLGLLRDAGYITQNMYKNVLTEGIEISDTSESFKQKIKGMLSDHSIPYFVKPQLEGFLKKESKEEATATHFKRS